jgi:glycogen debranching enzyme
VEKCIENFWVKDVLFNSILVENLRALAHIASLLKHADGEQFALHNAECITEAMRRHMLEDGVYWSTAGLANRKLKVATWNHFMPLFAGFYTPPEATDVVAKHFRNDDTFHARFGIRTVSRKEPGYRGEGFPDGFSWRGPVWISSHWFIYRGLVRYGFLKEADEIRQKSEALIERAGFRECFNPDTGEGQGAHNFTWGALVLDMRDQAPETPIAAPMSLKKVSDP